MAKTIFEQMGGTYTRVGDYYLPNLKLPEEEKQANIGVWGMRHKRFLKENHRVLYTNIVFFLHKILYDLFIITDNKMTTGIMLHRNS